MTIFEAMSIVGLFIGPIVGALITLRLQERGADRERKMFVFRSLMKNRRSWLEPEHVFALNLIEVEFRDYPEVTSAMKDFFNILDDQQRNVDEVAAADALQEVMALKDRAFNERVAKKRNKLYTVMLSRMAKVLKYKLDDLELLDGGYWPRYFGDIQEQQRMAREYVSDLYLGRRVVPIYVTNIGQPSDVGRLDTDNQDKKD